MMAALALTLLVLVLWIGEIDLVMLIVEVLELLLVMLRWKFEIWFGFLTQQVLFMFGMQSQKV